MPKAKRSAIRSKGLLALLAAIILVGFALRLWSARGGLWVDEAWSAVMVERARTPIGIFTAINHDNNHHLNSLWMWLIGYGAPPIALRALSIATGTATILVAAAIGARTSAACASITAALVAVSPMMVDYGSEARGYAPMLLALMIMIRLVLRWLETPDAPPPRWRLAGLAMLGLLAQLTLVFGIVALAIWVAVVLARDRSVDFATTRSIRLWLPTAGAAVAIVALVLGAAAASPTGMQVGDYVPFSPDALWRALRTMVAATLGGLDAPAWLDIVAVLALLATLAIALYRREPVAIFAVAAIVGLPLALALLRVGNTGMPRYFLLSSVALLLVLAGRLAESLGQRRPMRIASAAVLVVLIVAMIRDDLSQAALRRGDTGAAIATMTALAPNGATILVEHLRPIATLRVGAAETVYPLRIVDTCPAPMFVHLDLVDGAVAPRAIMRCGTAYRLRVVRRRGSLSGVDWALYARAQLPEKRAGPVR